MSILGPFRSLAHLAGQAFAATLHGAVHARTAQAFAGFGAMGADAEVGEPAEQSCECWPVENPWTHYGIPEPGGALEYNPDCPEHGKDAGARFATGSYVRQVVQSDGTWGPPEYVRAPESSAASPSPDAADDPTAPTPTPDAAGSPTLGNDPGAVHERRMRQLTDEDRSTTK